MAIAKAAGLAALEHLREKIQGINAKLLPVAAQRMGAAFLKEIADEFKQSRDPYGKPWAPVNRMRAVDRRAKARRAASGRFVKGDKPLVDTGRLRASPSVQPSGTLVRVFLPVSYASFHQYGTKRIPRRQILPEGNTGGLGPRWTRAANKAMQATLDEYFAKK